MPDLRYLGSRITNKLQHHVGTARRWIKSILAKAIYSLPFLSHYNPRRKIVSCKDHCRTVDHYPAGGESITDDWYLKIRPRETLQRQPSLCLDDNEAGRFRAGTEKYQLGNQFEIPEIFLACFRNARIEGRDFLLLSRENRILFESALSRNEVLEKNGLLDRLIHPTAKSLHGTHILLAHPWAYGYYHWMIEVLPRLSLIEKFDELASVPLIVPHRLNTFQRDSLRMAGVRDDRLVHLDNDDWQVDRLIFPEMLAPSGSPSPHAVAWLRKVFLDEAPVTSRAKASRIYLTRRDAPKRKILNEDEIIAFLEQKGFETACLSELSLSEQIALFQGASVVVAPHGAGQTNMVFAPAGAILIEMFGDNYINGCYWALTNICGQKHAFLTAPTETLDYSVPVEQLKALLAKVAGI
jgi:capsular polysaccharide biosynthesis protein